MMNIKTLKSAETPWHLILIFIFLSLGIVISGYLYFKQEEKHLEKIKHEELAAIADLKSDQIRNWRAERIIDGSIIATSSFASRLKKYLETGDSALKKELFQRLISLKIQPAYEIIALADASGNLIMSTHNSDSIGPYGRSIISTAISRKEAIISDFHEAPHASGIHLDLAVPLFPHNKEMPVGAFFIRIDPDVFLYPLIQSWPTTSPTAETLLVRREDSKVVFLNELRHRKGSPLSLTAPLSQLTLPAVQAALGKTGMFEGIDYRGVPVLTAIRQIPDTPWSIVAKIDINEVFAPVRKTAITISVLIAIMVLSSGLCIALLWRHQRAEHYKSQYNAEIRHSSLLQRYEYISRYANDIILQLDLQGNVMDANERALQAYGYALDELLGMNIRDLRQPDTLAVIEDDLRRVKEQNGFIFETVHQRKDGTTFPVEVSSRVIEADHMKAYVSIVRNITERKEHERSLTESEERFRDLSHQFNALLDAIPDDITLLSSSLKIIWANKAAEEKLIRKTTDYSQECCYALRHDRSTPCDNCPVPITFATGKPESKIVKTTNGIWDMRTAPIFGADGRVASVINIARDITEQRRIEEQLLHSQKLEGIGQLAGGVAHDFNNILAAIIGYASLLQMQIGKDNPISRNIEHILSATDRAAVLTRSLLAFSRKQIMDPRPVDLNTLIQGIKKLLGRIIGEDIELKTELADSRLTVLADSGQIDQVLMNLATNARDAMPEGGLILIETDMVEINKNFIKTHGYGKAGHYARISFTDTGTGMDEMTKERIFEPFFTTKDVGKGTGLGLSMVFGIIKQHSGFINCYSEPGKGTTFRIYLPLIASTSEQVMPGDAETVMQLPRGTETILVAEDDKALRKLTSTVLNQFGYTVIEAQDGETALQKYLENKDSIKLLILDVVMPKKNGKETYDEIHSHSPDIRAIFVSGYTANLIHRKGILSEGVDFIMKPVSPIDLLKKVREVLDR